MTTVTKIYNKNYKIDFTSQQITFLDTRFYLSEAGNFLPSCTTLLEAYPKPAQFYDWIKKAGENADEIRDEAGRRGGVVHNLTEKYDKGEKVELLDPNGEVNLKLFEWNCFEKYVEFRNRFEVEIHAIECNLTSDRLGFAGTMDRDMTIKIKGKRYLVDIKTSNNIWDEYWLQLVGYEKLSEDINGYNRFDGRAILWLNAKTKTDGKKDTIQGKGWQLIIDEEDPTEKWEIFKATQKLWLAQNGGMKPKQTVYQLSHNLTATSEQWYNQLHPDKKLIVMDPDGWDRQNYQYSWFEEKITREEFDNRLLHSITLINK